MKKIRVQDRNSLNPDKIRIWLVTPQGEIMLKNFQTKGLPDLSGLTLEVNNWKDAIYEIENKWGIMTIMEDFNYALNEISISNQNIANYFISFDLDEYEKEVITSKYDGVFYKIKDIRKLISIPFYKKQNNNDFHSLLSKFFGNLHY